ncbi:hypothetical protein Tco_0273414 [Tanacetum coccineum]
MGKHSKNSTDSPHQRTPQQGKNMPPTDLVIRPTTGTIGGFNSRNLNPELVSHAENNPTGVSPVLTSAGSQLNGVAPNVLVTNTMTSTGTTQLLPQLISDEPPGTLCHKTTVPYRHSDRMKQENDLSKINRIKSWTGLKKTLRSMIKAIRIGKHIKAREDESTKKTAFGIQHQGQEQGTDYAKNTGMEEMVALRPEETGAPQAIAHLVPAPTATGPDAEKGQTHQEDPRLATPRQAVKTVTRDIGARSGLKGKNPYHGAAKRPMLLKPSGADIQSLLVNMLATWFDKLPNEVSEVTKDLRRTTAKAFAKDVFINQERKLGARRRSDTVLVSTINDADQGSADVAYRTPLAPYEKSKFLGSGGSMVARLKLKGIDGRAPPGVEPAA